MTRCAFTLLEIMATMLLLAFGLMSVIGMVQYGTQLGSESQSRATAMLTARTVLIDAEPVELIADPGDANGDGWYLDSGTMNAPSSGPYEFKVRGFANGYYLTRVERSSEDDILDPHNRIATVTVTVFVGADEFTTLRQRLIRRTGAP